MDTPTSIVPPAAPAAPHPVPYGGVPASPPQNVLAWVSLGLAVGFVLFSVFTSIPAIICGHIARAQIRRTGEQGGAAALTGLILGYVFTALTLLAIAVFLFFVFAAAAAIGTANGV